VLDNSNRASVNPLIMPPERWKTKSTAKCDAEQSWEQDLRGRLLEVLDEGDDQRALGEEHSGNPLDEPELEIFEIGFRGECRGVQFLEGLGDAFGLRAREASGFEFLDDAVRVDHERLHMSSFYHLPAGSQGAPNRRCQGDCRGAEYVAL
jgi:hypothetical protein